MSKELLAVRALFDSRHDDLNIPLQDTNQYALGRITQHNVVDACLPSGNMKKSFQEVNFCLLVGVRDGMRSNRMISDLAMSSLATGVVQFDLSQKWRFYGDRIPTTPATFSDDR